MKDRRVDRVRSAIAGCITLCCLTACGGTTVSASFLTASPQGNGVRASGYAYIASTNGQQAGAAGSVYQYAIAANGSLAPLRPPSVPTGVDPRSVIVDPTGHFVYSANSGDATIYQFAVGAGGALTPLLPSSVILPGVPPSAQNYSLSVDPAGPYVYVVVSAPAGSQPQALIGQFSIAPNGTLTALIPAVVSVPAFASSALAIDPTGAQAYLGAGLGTSGSAGAVFQFAIGAQGALTPLPAASVSTAAPVVAIAFAPSGNTAYLLSQCIDSACDGSITPYSIANAGGLGAAGAVTLTDPHVNPVDLVVDGSGTVAYLLANFMGVDFNTGAVYQYAIGGSGALVPSMASSIPLTGAGVALSAFGPDLYALSGPGSATGGGNSYLAIFSIGSQGEITSVSNTQIAATTPSGMALIATQ